MLGEGCGEHSILVPLSSGATNPSCWDCPNGSRAVWGDSGQLNLVPFLWSQSGREKSCSSSAGLRELGIWEVPVGWAAGSQLCLSVGVRACRGMEELAQRGFRKSL